MRTFVIAVFVLMTGIAARGSEGAIGAPSMPYVARQNSEILHIEILRTIARENVTRALNALRYHHSEGSCFFESRIEAYGAFDLDDIAGRPVPGGSLLVPWGVATLRLTERCDGKTKTLYLSWLKEKTKQGFYRLIQVDKRRSSQGRTRSPDSDERGTDVPMPSMGGRN
jgi:hypothetical protein